MSGHVGPEYPDANGWGNLLEFTDPDGNPKTWAMPASLLSGEGAEWAGRLRDMGLQMAPGTAARNRVAQYIDTRNPAERVTCTDRVGWHGSVYVLPSSSIGTAEGRRFVFQSESGMEDTFRRCGELADWRAQVAAPCLGNSRLMFALSCAFAGPMLRPAEIESGGFHFRSGSSQGKTSALLLAASVWGRPSYVQRWRTTDNALEATAVQHSDGLLILDEIQQLDANKAGECAYMLANEQEKGRATRGGLSRKRRTWRLLFLSSGEVSLATHMAEAGKRTMAGQEVRMVDVPLDAGQGMGAIEALNGHEGPGQMVEAITGAASRCYGSAGRAWLEWACKHQAGLAERLAELVERYRLDMVPEAASEQVRRVGRRFAVVAASGELAGEACITGWAEGKAAWAARQCFNAWLAARGHMDNGEDAAMLRQAQAWLEKNGDALFTWHHRAMDDHRGNTPLRAGFKRLVGDDGKPIKFDAATDYAEKRAPLDSQERPLGLVEFMVLPEAFRRDVCKGFDPAALAALLRRRGHLIHEADRLTVKQRLPGMGKAACYHIKPSIFDDQL
jgi:putative DNA primase/helicase